MENLDLVRLVREKTNTLSRMSVVTGFDGFVDELVSIVEERQDLENYKRIETISEHGQRVLKSAGHSSLNEIVVRQVDPGGCAINMGDGLASLGIPVTTFATVGDPLHPAFQDYAGKAKLISWGAEPGRTIAFEFADGKLMYSAVTQLQGFKPEALEVYLQDQQFQQACKSANMVAFTDWSMYPHMTACWRFLMEAVFSKLESVPPLFFDLVDPSSRSDADIRDMMTALGEFGKLGSVTLGLNKTEANILSRLLGCEVEDADNPIALASQARALREKLGIECVVIHTNKFCAGSSSSEVGVVYGAYCENPVKSTGAGDRFNAGFTIGKLLELDLTDCLVLATACSGLFVTKGESGSLEEMLQFIEQNDSRITVADI
ncbi:MAG: PfkB family carbohydrate kinase [Puniceicoccaceae bacterium]